MHGQHAVTDDSVYCSRAEGAEGNFTRGGGGNWAPPADVGLIAGYIPLLGGSGSLRFIKNGG